MQIINVEQFLNDRAQDHHFMFQCTGSQLKHRKRQLRGSTFQGLRDGIYVFMSMLSSVRTELGESMGSVVYDSMLERDRTTVVNFTPRKIPSRSLHECAEVSDVRNACAEYVEIGSRKLTTNP